VSIADIGKARRMLQYEPAVDLEEGLRRTWEWFSTHEKVLEIIEDRRRWLSARS
jgi:dTDP-D-glucose 4,6-dehydratase